MTELAFCRLRLLGVSIVEFCDFEARKGSLDDSIKNWPSILCCCLGGVRGIGQIGESLVPIVQVVQIVGLTRSSATVFALSDAEVMFEQTSKSLRLFTCIYTCPDTSPLLCMNRYMRKKDH